MSQSSVKKRLLQQGRSSPTPAKKIVNGEINSWMETYQKQQKVAEKKIQNNGGPKFKIKKKINFKQNSDVQTKNQQQSQIQNISELKKRRDDLMKSLSNKKWVNQNTKANTAEGSHSSKVTRKPLDWFMRLPLVHVNQFVSQENDTKKFQQVTLIPETKPFIQGQGIISKKNSLKKIDRNKSEKPSKHSYCKYLQTKIQNCNTQNRNIIQQNILRNNYIGLLASISRKTSNVLVSVRNQNNRTNC